MAHVRAAATHPTVRPVTTGVAKVHADREKFATMVLVSPIILVKMGRLLAVAGATHGAVIRQTPVVLPKDNAVKMVIVARMVARHIIHGEILNSLVLSVVKRVQGLKHVVMMIMCGISVVRKGRHFIVVMIGKLTLIVALVEHTAEIKILGK